MLSLLLPQKAAYTDGVTAGDKVSQISVHHGKSLQFFTCTEVFLCQRGRNFVLCLAVTDLGTNVQWLVSVSPDLPTEYIKL
jgi:hypothetical protein